MFGSYVEPDYARDVQHDRVPPNVRILEFYLTPGAFLGSQHAQRHYLSANYTHVAREVLARGVNVIAQLVARRNVDGELQLSLGSNPDVTADLLPLVAAARAGGRDIVLVGETHAQMPFMTGHAQVDPQAFDFLVDSPRYDYDLFGPPNPPLATVDHAIGLHASSLVRDGGTLQVGIGELGDALIYSLLLRHQQNAAVARRARRARRAARRRAGPGRGRRGAVRDRAVRRHARCSSTSCSTCIAPASCGGASTTPCRSSGCWPAAAASASTPASWRRCPRWASGRA